MPWSSLGVGQGLEVGHLAGSPFPVLSEMREPWERCGFLFFFSFFKRGLPGCFPVQGREDEVEKALSKKFCLQTEEETARIHGSQ